MAYDLGLAERVRSLLERHSGFSERKMFGGICFMVNGNMCCGVLKTDLMLRLTPEEADLALKRPHVRPMDFTRTPMKSMVYVSAQGVDADQDLHHWVELARSIARKLPPKESAVAKKPKKSASPSSRRSSPRPNPALSSNRQST